MLLLYVRLASFAMSNSFVVRCYSYCLVLLLPLDSLFWFTLITLQHQFDVPNERNHSISGGCDAIPMMNNLYIALTCPKQIGGYSWIASSTYSLSSTECRDVCLPLNLVHLIEFVGP
eukprot:619179_1